MLSCEIQKQESGFSLEKATMIQIQMFENGKPDIVLIV